MTVDRTARVCIILLAALPAACENRWNQSQQVTAAFARPEVPRPIGPVPGPGAAADVQGNPLAGNKQAMWAGRKLFVSYNCSGCHGGRAGGGMGPTLRDQDWIYGNKPADIFDSIASGRAKGMPAWGTKIPQQQIWELVAYIQSLNGPDEPERPQ